MMKKIILIGGGGHCHSVIDVIEQEKKYEIIGIIDKEELVGNTILGYKVIGTDSDLEKIYSHCENAIITIGQIESNKLRVKIFDKLKHIGFNLPVIISPLSYVSKHSSIDEGTVVMHNVLINANAKIGRNCIINTKALIEHDVYIGSHCHISTASVVNGGVSIEDNTFLGSNVTSKQGIKIKGFIKAGSVVK